MYGQSALISITTNMLFTNHFTFVLAFLSITSTVAAPGPLASPTPDIVRSVRNEFDARQLPILISGP